MTVKTFIVVRHKVFAETIYGLYKTKVIHNDGPWKGLDELDMATLSWVDWLNNKWIMQPLDDMPSREYEEIYYRQQLPSQSA